MAADSSRPARAGGQGELTRRQALRAGLVAIGAVATGCTAAGAGAGPGAAPGATPPAPTTRTSSSPSTTRPPAASGEAPAPVGTIYIAGDSTAATYVASYKPQAGWGQALPLFIGGGATVSNQAIGGRSTRSFIEDGRLTRILGTIRAGDLFLVSFGHNDEGSDPKRHTDAATSYKAYLRQYVDGALARRAKPVLLTPVERRHFDSQGRITPTHRAYATAMKEVAAEKRVPLVDLTALSTDLWNRLGPERTKTYFLWTGSKQDNTHFQAKGAIEVARLVATALRDQRLLPASQVRQLSATIPDSALTWK